MHEHGRSLVKKLEGKPFIIVGVNSDSNRAKVKDLSAKKGPPWRSFWDGGSINGPIQNQWNIQAWPTMYLIDHKGVIRHKYLGSPGDKVMDKVIDELVKEAEAGSAKKSGE